MSCVKNWLRQGADLKGSLWALHGNEWTRSEEQRHQRSALCDRFPKLGRAIGRRDMLQDVLADEDHEACGSAPGLAGWNPFASRPRAYKNIGAALSRS